MSRLQEDFQQNSQEKLEESQQKQKSIVNIRRDGEGSGKQASEWRVGVDRAENIRSVEGADDKTQRGGLVMDGRLPR